MKNQWFFQQQLSNFPLVTFTASACSLTNMWGSNNAVNSNASFYCLDTTVFASPYFQFKGEKPTQGYTIVSQQHLWGLDTQALTFKDNKYQNLIYLGNTMENKRGATIQPYNKYQDYKFDDWGNPFFGVISHNT